jgi:membrane protein DedA with SNARE-associated domain
VGPLRLRAILIRYGNWIGVSEQDLDRSEAWFDRRSRSAVLICRCVPLLRSVISVPAGFRRMPFGVFMLFTVIGSLVWNTGLITAGYLLADQWERVLDFTEPFQTIVVVVIGVAVVAFIGRRLILNRRERAAIEQKHPGLTHESLEEVVDDLEHQAATDPVLRSKLHED